MSNAQGDKLKAARIRAGLTQAQLADAVGLTRGAIAHYEHGRYRPHPIIAKVIKETLTALSEAEPPQSDQ